MKNKERFEKVKKLFKEEFKKNPEDIETVEEFLKLNKILWEKKHICFPSTDFFYRKKIICINCQGEETLLIKKGETVEDYLIWYPDRYKEEEKKCKKCECVLEDNYINHLEPWNFELLKYNNLRNLLGEIYG